MNAKTNPAVSPRQYRLAEAVLHGAARGPVRMSKAAAKEIVERTPAKQRSEFMKVNHAKKRNFSLFKKPKTSTEGMGRLEKEAYHRGYLGNEKAFDSWLKRSVPKHTLTHHSRISEKDLRRAFSLGESARQEHEAAKKQIGLLKQEKKEGPKPPAPPKGEKLASLGEEYKGRQIRRTAKGFEVLGETWNTMSQAKEYVDLYNVTGGNVRTKTNPRSRIAEATLSQGKSRANVFETSTGHHTAEVIPASGGREEHSFSGPGSFKAAMSWARLRLHEVANPPGKRFKLYAKNPGKRKNPADPAARMYEKFHGAPSTEVREYVEGRHRHNWLAGLGPLISINVRNVKGNRDAELVFPDPMDASVGDVVMLCATEDGTQLIPVGGDQELPVKMLIEKFSMVPVDFQRDNALIGTILQITYRTKKKFEKNGQEEIDFYHALGSEGSQGVYPVLVYHPRDKSIEIVGGRYYIGKAEPSLGNVSPGLIG